MDAPAATQLDATQRATLRGLADWIVPATDGMPSASEVGVPDKWIDRVLKARPELFAPLAAVLDGAAGADPEAELVRLNEHDPDSCAQLILAVTGAYYLHPRVRKLYGYPGQKPTPALPDESDYYLRDGILDPVVGRGPVYRPTPGAA